MKHLGVLLLPPGQDASPSQRYPTAECPCPRKQRDGQGLNPGHPDPEFEVLPTRSHTPPQKEAYGCTNEAPVGGRGGRQGEGGIFLLDIVNWSNILLLFHIPTFFQNFWQHC